MRPLFVLIKCELGKTYDVAGKLVDELEHKPEVYSISGDFDLLAKFWLPEDVNIGHFVCNHLQVLPGIKDTSTLIAFKCFTEEDFPLEAG